MVRADTARQKADRLLFERAKDACGTYSELARRLGWPLTTIHGWARRGSVPSYRADAIRALVKNHDRQIKNHDRQKRKLERGRARKRAH